MKVFKDANGKDWCMNLTFGAIERIRAEAGVDLLDLDSIQKLDAVKAAHAIAAACHDEIEKRGMTAQDFINSFDGDTIEVAGDALWEELMRFFPKRRREVVQKISAAATVVMEKELANMEARIESGEIQSLIEKTLKLPSGAPLESPESTPTLSPSVNSAG